jgi:hypothetical protein
MTLKTSGRHFRAFKSTRILFRAYENNIFIPSEIFRKDSVSADRAGLWLQARLDLTTEIFECKVVSN